MAKLKRNTIELLKEMNGEEVVMQRYLTPPFIPLSVVYEAADLMEKYELKEKKNDQLTSQEVKEYLAEMSDFVANRIYNKQFTKEDLEERFHAPDAFNALQSQILFIAWGVQSDETKKFLEKKA